MKTTRINCGAWSINNTDVELASDMFGPGGTQSDRRWFYRLLDTEHEGRRKAKFSRMDLVLYFRNSVDATFFALKKSG
jgi:hypothetical protein